MRILLSLFALLPALSAVAAPVAVVPGSNASYLYLPASTATSKVTVTFFKEGDFTDYTITSNPSGVSCRAEETQCSAKLVADATYTFTATGKYSEALYILPSWTEGCASELSQTCTTAISSGISIKVNVSALSSAELTPVMVNNKGKARFLYQRSDGAYLVGATSELLRNAMWQTTSVTTGATDISDGRNNMGKISDSAHVTHCLSGLSSDLGSDWYWPAYSELESINLTSWMSIVNVKELWSSTEASSTNAYKRNMEKGETKAEAKTKTDRNGLCVKRF